MEFDMAFHDIVVVKRKSRLIVLMMLDNPANLDDYDVSDTGTLRQYLHQYTYIDYTADDWLDKLLYALPLRGLLQHNEDPNVDVLLQRNLDRDDNVVELMDDVQFEWQWSCCNFALFAIDNAADRKYIDNHTIKPTAHYDRISYATVSGYIQIDDIRDSVSLRRSDSRQKLVARGWVPKHPTFWKIA